MKSLLSSNEHDSMQVDPLLGGMLPRTKSGDGERLYWTYRGGFTVSDTSPTKRGDFTESTFRTCRGISGETQPSSVVTPLRLNVNIREAIQGNVLGRRVSDSNFNPNTALSGSGTTTGISGPMASLTNAFVAIASHQKVRNLIII